MVWRSLLKRSRLKNRAIGTQNPVLRFTMTVQQGCAGCGPLLRGEGRSATLALVFIRLRTLIHFYFASNHRNIPCAVLRSLRRSRAHNGRLHHQSSYSGLFSPQSPRVRSQRDGGRVVSPPDTNPMSTAPIKDGAIFFKSHYHIRQLFASWPQTRLEREGQKPRGGGGGYRTAPARCAWQHFRPGRGAGDGLRLRWKNQ